MSRNIKKIDKLGRVSIPKKLRNTSQIGEKTKYVEIYCAEDDDSIIIKKCEQSCFFCGKTKGTVNIRGKSICPECLQNLKIKNERE